MKTIHTLDVGYPSEITQFTYPTLLRYASRIGASFNVIRDRKFPTLPVVYEKLQLHDLGKQSDWNLFIDADVMIHSDMPDVTEYLNKDTILFYGTDLAGSRFKPNDYSRRDGRFISPGSWFVIFSNWCLDLWKPIPFEDCVSNIEPLQFERNAGITPDSLIDDYVLTQNIARFGLKVDTLVEMGKRFSVGLEGGFDPSRFFWHRHALTNEQKIDELKRMNPNQTSAQ